MGSMGNNPSNTNWPPYNGYRDCSQGICSIYCPQWCYIIFPPPPPFQSGDDDSGMNFSPLIIIVIGVLASAFLLVSYYTIISKYCKRRGINQLNPSLDQSDTRNHLSTTHDQLQHAGLDESLIKSIAVCRYMKGDGVVEGADCAVCLSEFQEGENLRLLPKCGHAFHLPCIDTWLRSHSNCPLCRAHVMPGIPIPFQRPNSHVSQIGSSNFNVSSLVLQRRNADIVLVVEETQRDDHRVVNVVTNENLREYDPFHELEYNNGDHAMNMGNGEGQEVRRSTSLGSMSFQNQSLLIADILRIDQEDHEDYHHEQVGPSKGENSKSTKKMKRSGSTAGRFMFIRNDKGNNSMIPN